MFGKNNLLSFGAWFIFARYKLEERGKTRFKISFMPYPKYP